MSDVARAGNRRQGSTKEAGSRRPVSAFRSAHGAPLNARALTCDATVMSTGRPLRSTVSRRTFCCGAPLSCVTRDGILFYG